MDAKRYFAPAALLPASGSDLAVLTGVSLDRCEPYLYLNMLNTLADTRFPAEAIPRYVRGLYGLKSDEFLELVESVDEGIRRTSGMWEVGAERVVRDLLRAHNVELLGIRVAFQAFLLGVELDLSVALPVDRVGVVALVEGIRDISAQLAEPGERRPVGASIIGVVVWCRHPVLGWTHALRVATTGATAVEYAQRDAKRWLRDVEASLHPTLSDYLVRASKAKLAALGGLNRGLQAFDRFLRKL